MADKPKPKRLSKGGRIHVRRMKEAARKAEAAEASRRSKESK
ncbi:MAG TPA: hypothetical protein PKE64_01835 [Anaerolineae bacterium]|nr:hypothetical protein [Anaerolineae bacterium]HMR62726.1 hypothetical protein [Anaerolineae bacterium]